LGIIDIQSFSQCGLHSFILGVPASVNSGVANTEDNFYDIEGQIEYGKTYSWPAMRKAQVVGDF
jgi:hypothetical protein